MTSSLSIARPGVRLGTRPERSENANLDELDKLCSRWIHHRIDPQLRSFRAFQDRIRDIDEVEENYKSLDLASRNSMLIEIKDALSNQQLTTSDIVRAFALIRFAMEQTLNIRLYDQQLYAGWCLLAGHFIEMQTGEGKTVTAALPATVMALAGVPVHVVTTNEYLVTRDSSSLAPVFRWFGLSSGVVLSSQDDTMRRAGYACDITYATHQQVVFDYLRDVRMMGPFRNGIVGRLRPLLEEAPLPALQRGLCFAIIDEADSVLIDDARTPLILAETTSADDTAKAEAAVALAVARDLEESSHYILESDIGRAQLTDTGKLVVRERTAQLVGSWQLERFRFERICQALVALHLYRRDIDYLVQDDRVDLIDQSTGRATPQRRLQHGLHQILEVKERCSLSDESNPVSAISFQRYFARYYRLSGMSGTLREARKELRQVYGPRVLSIPSVRPTARRALLPLITMSREVQLMTLLKQVVQLQAAGRAVLIGTRTVKLSEQVSGVLRQSGIEHTVLNARQDIDEASAVAQAGLAGQVTVATNMAGRGTDIKPAQTVITAGGLHVINLEINDSRRVDRQLHGRAARQGEPGSYRDLFSLDDELLRKELNPMFLGVLSWRVQTRQRPTSFGVAALLQYVQKKVEQRHCHERVAVFTGQTQLQRTLAVGGCSE